MKNYTDGAREVPSGEINDLNMNHQPIPFHYENGKFYFVMQ